jgi:DNA repair protein RecN (Recombination protein N)
VADVVGGRLQRLGGRFQVLCITHLPQIAAYGSTHFHIEKSVTSGRTVTGVKRLDAVQRAEELARMIAGADVSAAVLASAREMLAAKSEQKTKGESERERRGKA